MWETICAKLSGSGWDWLDSDWCAFTDVACGWKWPIFSVGWYVVTMYTRVCTSSLSLYRKSRVSFQVYTHFFLDQVDFCILFEDHSLVFREEAIFYWLDFIMLKQFLLSTNPNKNYTRCYFPWNSILFALLYLEFRHSCTVYKQTFSLWCTSHFNLI